MKRLFITEARTRLLGVIFVVSLYCPPLVPPSAAIQANSSSHIPGKPIVTLCDNSNGAAVNNAPQRRTACELKTDTYVTEVWTYHWNYGRGANPGTISLQLQSQGKLITFGPFRVVATDGQNGAPNVNWTAAVNQKLPAGDYFVVDSDPDTWAQNSASDYRGFAIVRGVSIGEGPLKALNPSLGPASSAPSNTVSVNAPATRAPAGWHRPQITWLTELELKELPQDLRGLWVDAESGEVDWFDYVEGSSKLIARPAADRVNSASLDVDWNGSEWRGKASTCPRGGICPQLCTWDPAVLSVRLGN